MLKVTGVGNLQRQLEDAQPKLAAADEPFFHHLRSFSHFLSTRKLQYWA
jgi:hypothetical protein